MTVKELIDKLQQFDEDKLVLVEDIEYKEFQALVWSWICSSMGY